MNISSIAWVGVGVTCKSMPLYLSMLITSSLLSSRAPDRAVTEACSNVHSITAITSPAQLQINGAPVSVPEPETGEVVGATGVPSCN